MYVRYVPREPELNIPAWGRPSGVPIWVPFLVAAQLAGGGLLIFARLSLQRRILSEGRAAPGLITYVGKVQRGPHGNNLGQKFRYEFLLLSGSIRQGKGGPVKNPPAVGTPICVLYDPDNPKKNIPYPVRWARLVHGPLIKGRGL